ncbi:MAG: glycosyl hydrolase family 18 protein [Armatimonadota bacterium]
MTDRTPNRRRRRLKWFLFGLLVAAFLVTLDYFLYPLMAVSAPAGNTGENGLWLRYTWYFGEKSEAEWAVMTARLRDEQIRDAFFHVRYIQPDGTLHFRYPEQAKALTARVHREAPGVRVVAWIYAENKPGAFFVDVADPKIRQRMVAEAVWLVRECGFDGVQWDYEVVKRNDPHLLKLLEDTREALPETFLSVCTPPWYPKPVVWFYGWDEAYFARVAARCDQLAVMGYDTGMPLPRLYVWLMRWQVVHVTRAAAEGNPACRVLIGLPTYDNRTRSHYPSVETLRLALKGTREGLASKRAVPESFSGVSLFADYTTSAEEWGQYEALWLMK